MIDRGSSNTFYVSIVDCNLYANPSEARHEDLVRLNVG